VKSTKHIGNLLLLECHRYSPEGLYLEGIDGNPVRYDFIFLVRVKGVESASPDDYKNFSDLSCEVTGFITHQQFCEAISSKAIIPKGVKIGIPMIVDNYYICAADLTMPDKIRFLTNK
jgi:hypothetical protein